MQIGRLDLLSASDVHIHNITNSNYNEVPTQLLKYH